MGTEGRENRQMEGSAWEGQSGDEKDWLNNNDNDNNNNNNDSKCSYLYFQCFQSTNRNLTVPYDMC